MFKIVSSSGAIMQHQVRKEVAKPAAREILREKAGGEIVDGGAQGIKTASLKDNWWNGRIDMKEAAKNAQKYRKDYERTLPEKLNPESENFMWKRAKQLKDEFTVGMLSKEEMHPVKGFLDNGAMKYVVDEEKMRSSNTVKREHDWQKKNEEKIREFKNIMRHLNPDDPNAGDVERFRPRRGV